VEDFGDFLRRFWWVLFIIVPWVLSAVGDVFTKAARKAAEQERARRRERQQGTAPSDLQGAPQSDPQGGPQRGPQSVPLSDLQRGPQSVPLSDLQRGPQSVPLSGPESGPHAGPIMAQPQHPRRPSAEEVAAEIRRMMGLEVQEEHRSPSRPGSEAEWQEADWQETEWQEAEWQEPEPEPPPLPRRQAEQFGSLHERMAHKDRRQISHVEGRHIQPATAHGGVHDRHLQTGLMQKLSAREGKGTRASRALPDMRLPGAGGLVDLADPARAFVMLEVLGPPKALRDETF
jgi:hypothetical protein